MAPIIHDPIHSAAETAAVWLSRQPGVRVGLPDWIRQPRSPLTAGRNPRHISFPSGNP
jgi:hypothetical protein